MVKRVFNWVRDEEDDRDLMYVRRISEGALPEAVDLRGECSGIRDQGSLGSCCAFAGCGLIEMFAKQANAKVKVYSPLFVYYNLRESQGTVREDSGGSIRGTMKTLQKKGACRESQWPYKIRKFKERPPGNSYRDGMTHQITSYARVQDVTGIREALANGDPVIIGIDVYQSFEETGSDGIVPMPDSSEELLGGHAIGIFGYLSDFDGGYFICRNSWGKSWGKNGYFFLRPEYIGLYGADFWVLKAIEV